MLEVFNIVRKYLIYPLPQLITVYQKIVNDCIVYKLERSVLYMWNKSTPFAVACAICGLARRMMMMIMESQQLRL